MAEREVTWGPRNSHTLIGKSISRIDGVQKAMGRRVLAAVMCHLEDLVVAQPGCQQPILCGTLRVPGEQVVHLAMFQTEDDGVAVEVAAGAS